VLYQFRPVAGHHIQLHICSEYKDFKYVVCNIHRCMSKYMLPVCWATISVVAISFGVILLYMSHLSVNFYNGAEDQAAFNDDP